MSTETTLKRVLNRGELYRDVWSRPLTEIAAELGISSRELKHICVAMDIPNPEPEFLVRAQQGKTAGKPALPKATAKTRLRWDMDIENPRSQMENPALPTLKKESDQPETPSAETESSANIQRLHPLVRSTRAHERESHSRIPWDQRKERKRFCVKVSFGAVDRAMNFLDGFARGVEAQGLAFRSPLDEQPVQKTDRYSHNYQQPSGICWIEAGDERIGFSLSERNRRVELDESKATLWEKWTSEPTGVLEFSLDRPWGFLLTTTWKDRKRQRIEERMGEIVATLGPLAEFKKCERLRREREEARQRQLSNLGYHMKIQRKMEEEALEIVLQDAKLHQRAAELRRYAVALRAKLLPELKPMTVDSSHDRLLRWIETRAEMMDPLEGAVEERMRGLASKIPGLHET